MIGSPICILDSVGPGCSSIGYGALVELGPLKIDENGVGLVFNNYSWISGRSLSSTQFIVILNLIHYANGSNAFLDIA